MESNNATCIYIYQNLFNRFGIFFVSLNTVTPISYFHHLDNTSVMHKSEAYFESRATKVG